MEDGEITDSDNDIRDTNRTPTLSPSPTDGRSLRSDPKYSSSPSRKVNQKNDLRNMLQEKKKRLSMSSRSTSKDYDRSHSHGKRERSRSSKFIFFFFFFNKYIIIHKNLNNLFCGNRW